MVQKTGCSVKIPAQELKQVLSALKPNVSDLNLLIDGGTFDDAAVYKVSENMALVQTVDFFTPSVDSPYEFGKIAAANALSDVYAMGGVPKLALAVLGYPLATLDKAIVQKIMQGAQEVLQLAQTHLVGGHSIDNADLIFGFSVTGFVNPQKIWSNQGAQGGDLLILTKPIGVSALTTALKRGLSTEKEIEIGIQSMSTLNEIQSLLSEDNIKGIHAVTDITGFGLSGHAMQMAIASQKTIKIRYSDIPCFKGALDILEQGLLTKAHRTNRAYTQEQSDWSVLSETEQLMINDPQTSGGLLISVSPLLANEILDKLKIKFVNAAIIGQVMDKNGESVTHVSLNNDRVIEKSIDKLSAPWVIYEK